MDREFVMKKSLVPPRVIQAIITVVPDGWGAWRAEELVSKTPAQVLNLPMRLFVLILAHPIPTLTTP